MGLEIERKFLVPFAPNIEQKLMELSHASYVISQAYITPETECVVRIREFAAIKKRRSDLDRGGLITVKSYIQKQKYTRKEYEYAIPYRDAQEMINSYGNKGLTKIRHNITYNGKLFEVDVFGGSSQGLIVAEVELQSEDEEIELPLWVGDEVSNDHRYFNYELSRTPYSLWKDK